MPVTSPGDRVLLQQLVADVAVVKASQTGRDREMSGLIADVREARDAALATTAVLKEMDFGTQLERLRAAYEADQAAMRQDVVHQHNTLKTDFKIIDDRLKPLEDARQQATGMGALLKAIKDFGPWVLAMGALVLHYLDGGRP